MKLSPELQPSSNRLALCLLPSCWHPWGMSTCSLCFLDSTCIFLGDTACTGQAFHEHSRSLHCIHNLSLKLMRLRACWSGVDIIRAVPCHCSTSPGDSHCNLPHFATYLAGTGSTETNWHPHPLSSVNLRIVCTPHFPQYLGCCKGTPMLNDVKCEVGPPQELSLTTLESLLVAGTNCWPKSC